MAECLGIGYVGMATMVWGLGTAVSSYGSSHLCSSWHGNHRCNLPFLVSVPMAARTKFSSSVYRSNSAGTVTRHLQDTAIQYTSFARKYSNIILSES